MSTKTTLKPCPFCGGAAEIVEHFKTWMVCCRLCGAETRAYSNGRNARAAWSLRASPANSYDETTCPTCGGRVRVCGEDGGTRWYEPLEGGAK